MVKISRFSSVCTTFHSTKRLPNKCRFFLPSHKFRFLLSASFRSVRNDSRLFQRATRTSHFSNTVPRILRHHLESMWVLINCQVCVVNSKFSYCSETISVCRNAEDILEASIGGRHQRESEFNFNLKTNFQISTLQFPYVMSCPHVHAFCIWPGKYFEVMISMNMKVNFDLTELSISHEEFSKNVFSKKKNRSAQHEWRWLGNRSSE